MQDNEVEYDHWLVARKLAGALLLSALAVVLIGLEPSLLSFAAGLIFFGCAQKMLFDLQRRAVAKSLIRRSTFNDLVGHWLCSLPIFSNLEDHLTLYEELMSEDPDACKTRKEEVFTWLRIVFGVTGARRLLASASSNLGLGYVSPAGVLVFAKPQKGGGAIFWKNLLRHFLPIFLVQLLMFGLCLLGNAPQAYLIWIVAYLTVFSLAIMDVQIELPRKWLRGQLEVLMARMPKRQTIAIAGPSRQAEIEASLRHIEVPRSLRAVELPSPLVAPAPE